MPQIFSLGGVPKTKTPIARIDKIKNTGRVDSFYAETDPSEHNNNFILDDYQFIIMECLYDSNDQNLKLYQNPRAYSIAYRNVLEIITKDGITIVAENIAENPADDNTL